MSLSGNNSGQVNHTHVPLLASSINWYRQKLGSKLGNCTTHRPRVRGLAASAGVWMRALNRRSALHQRARAHGQLYCLKYAFFMFIIVAAAVAENA